MWYHYSACPLPTPTAFFSYREYKLAIIISAARGNASGLKQIIKKGGGGGREKPNGILLSHITVQFIVILSRLLINNVSYKYSEKRARNSTIIVWVHGRHFLPAGWLFMWKRTHFTFKSTSVFAWIKFLLQLAKSGWPQGFTNKYVCYIFIILNMEIRKHKNCCSKIKDWILPKIKANTD